LKSSKTEQILKQALAAHSNNNLEQAIQYYFELIELGGSYYSELVNYKMASIDDSIHIKLCQDELQAAPNSITHMHALGRLMQKQGNYKAALEYFKRALSIQPNCPINRYSKALLHLQYEEYTLGWADYEARWQVAEFDNYAKHFIQPRWQGQPCRHKTLYIWLEQGIGDLIMVANLFARLLKICPNLIVEIPAKLQILFSRSYPEIKFVQEIPNKFDYHIPMMSLCKYLVPNKNALTNNKPYIKVCQTKATKFKQQISSNKKVIGITWQSSSKTWGMQNSVALQELLPTLKSLNQCYISLQHTSASKEITENKIHDLELYNFPTIDKFNDLDSLAAMVACCDYVITIDNYMTQFAPAIGIPTCALIPYEADWRWGVNNSSSSWHKNFNLFRQEKPNDWQAPINKLTEYLQKKLK